MTRLANVEDDIIAALEALEAELGAQNSEMAHVAEAGGPISRQGEHARQPRCSDGQYAAGRRHRRR